LLYTIRGIVALQMSKPKPKETTIELNDQFKRALDLMEHTDKSVFITGRAGTGKSTLLEYFRSTTKKTVAVLAPTGVAALNVKGQTIHSFFGFKPNITLDRVKRLRFSGRENVYEKLDAIVIDEISMVRADLLDCVDRFLRLNVPSPDRTFGGIQMILIGDLYQLPPVISGAERQIFRSFYETPYFYSARALDSFDMEFVELEKIYRQHDDQFINLLNSIRNNSIAEDGLHLLNQRYIPEFEPSPDDFYVYLTTVNKLAEEINGKELAKLDGQLYTFTGKIEGEFGNQYLPTAVDLQVKVGAQIMMLNNDAEGRWVNGTIGKIKSIKTPKDDMPVITALLSDGETVDIEPFIWEIFRFYIDGNQLQSDVIGTFTQYPLMLAWAVTIHKGQGKTFDKVIIDIGRGTFAHGQMYVALSRCTSLDGIVLRQPVQKQHVWTDYQIVKFLTRYQYQKAEQACAASEKMTLIEQAIRNKSSLRIVYLKPNDEKSTRVVEPIKVGPMKYNDVSFIGMRAFCHNRNQERTFRVDRILQIEEIY